MSSDFLNFNGYDETFLSNDADKAVNMPILGADMVKDLALIDNPGEYVLNYINYSAVLSKSRKLPMYVAANIDGSLFKRADRSSSWKKDSRIIEAQWGQELYTARPGFFDRGHLVKREDVQWGNDQEAQAAADSTFFYSNAVPQHKELNRKIWKRLENYILHNETTSKMLRICVFTGPILNPNDLELTAPVNGSQVKIPSLFWKVVVYQKNDGKLYRVGFLMGQRNLLLRDNLVDEPELETLADDNLFLEFSEADTYQVNVSLIEELSGLKLFEAIDSFQDLRSTKLVLKEVEFEMGTDSDDYSDEFYLENIVL